MDPQTITMIAQVTIGFLSPYFAKAGEAAAKKIGENIYSLLKDRFTKKATAQEALVDLQNAPDDPDLQAALRVQLKKLLKEDTVFAEKLQNLLEEVEKTAPGTTTNIIKMSAGDNAKQIGQVAGDVTFNETK
ncbi:MAG: hypothetical protein GY928_01490 [Colwellia sp.]|nr:hypothetical protein [Colwellia sp.]